MSQEHQAEGCRSVGASNTDLRSEPAVAGFLEPRAPGNRGRLWRFLTLALWGSTASLLKATNDPWLSNYWIFWTKPEDRAIWWADHHLRYRSVWLGVAGIRLSSHAAAEGFGNQSGNERDQWTVNVDTRDMLLSSTEEGASVRRMILLPDVRVEHRVYDNGTVAGYHLRPRTPYQR